ncbi:hypothetical protein ACIRSS_01970 [Amycolatopsis sp. NPDC101161]|uniref:hypothetical protein n=1 Tax=Amycolatopsis sp. NPDC101161 TaxID=3363940 RepID=UPI003826306C
MLTILARIERRLPERSAARVYEATRKATESARRRIYVTYFRSTSPTALDAAAQRHFKACRKWAASSPEHVFRRVLLNSDNPSMIDHLRQGLSMWVRQRTGRIVGIEIRSREVVRDCECLASQPEGG